MTLQELNDKTLVELKQLAKDHQWKVPSGLNKSGVVDFLYQCFQQQETKPATQLSMPVDAPAPAPSAAHHASAQPPRAAASDSPPIRYNAKPAYQAPAASYQGRSNWGTKVAPQPRPVPVGIPQEQPVRPAGYVPRFGPGSSAPREPQRPLRAQETPAMDRLLIKRDATAAEEDDSILFAGVTPVAEEPEAVSAPYRYADPVEESQESPLDADGAAVPLQAGSGMLEVSADGHGFLRNPDTMQMSSKDIYISSFLIRKLGLRPGDVVAGQVRPPREGDRVGAMQVVDTVNGLTREQWSARPIFEEMTPEYPKRRIQLDPGVRARYNDVRLVDLIAPIGFGQRGMILAPEGTGKTELIQNLANVIHRNHPKAVVLMLLIEENPEDVTMFRQVVKCPVYASTFDQPPEYSLRLCDMVMERAKRLVEMGRDVVVVMDSLIRLAKIIPSANASRPFAGAVNPSSLFRAKKAFGNARCMKEGGTLTLIGVMDVDEKNRVNASIQEEFKGTANMEIHLSAEVASAGIFPAIDLHQSGTKHADALLNEAQRKGLVAIRDILGNTASVTAIPPLLDMMDKTESNEAFLEKVTQWAAMMKKS